MKVFRSILFVLLWLGMIAAEVYAGLRLWKLEMLPMKYKLLLFIIFLTVWLLAGILFLSGSKAKKGKHPGAFRRFIAWILAIVMICGSLYSIRVADKVDETIETVTAEVAVTSTIGVYVMQDDPAQSIEDAKDYVFGVTESYDAANMRAAMQDLDDRLGTIEIERHSSVAEMVEALYSGDDGAIILNEAYASILEDQDDFTTFLEDTRVLYEIEVEEGDASNIIEGEELDTETSEVEIGDYKSMDNLVPVNVTEQPFVVYLSGSDTRSKMLATSRSDVNILMVINPKSKQVLMINTPRDYYVPNPAGGGALDKLTHCGIYGISCSVGALSNLYSVPVNYYAQINFTGFETLIDAIGGVTVYSDYAFTSRDGAYSYSVGDNHLNGSSALAFARERYAFASGDNQRGKNQMKILSAVIGKLSKTTVIMHHTEIMNSLQGMFVTNLSGDEINSLVRMQLGDGAEWNVKSFAVTGAGGSNYTYSMPGFMAYVMYQDANLVNTASNLVQRVLNGENLTDADVGASA